jgi:hypothetical protein
LLFESEPEADRGGGSDRPKSQLYRAVFQSLMALTPVLTTTVESFAGRYRFRF